MAFGNQKDPPKEVHCQKSGILRNSQIPVPRLRKSPQSSEVGDLVRIPAPVLPPIQALSELRDADGVLRRLGEIDWSFTKDDTAYLGHDLHPYPAKFIPQIPANLITSLSIRGEVVWDPFGGSGTCALEALLLGRRAISSDVNPLATLITRAKCTALSPEQRSALIMLHDRLRAIVQDHNLPSVLKNASHRFEKLVPAVPHLDKWFEPTAVTELAYILSEILTLPDEVSRDFARVSLSSIVLGASNQDGETRYAWREKDLPPGRVLRNYCQALIGGLQKHEPMERLLGYRRATCITGDIRQLDDEPSLAPDSVDLVVTSPPYANATDYHLYHRFRLFWMGFDPRQMAQREIGSHLRHQREKRGFELYGEEMLLGLKAIRTRLRPGRYAVLIVGDSVFDGQTIRTAEHLAGQADANGLEVVGLLSRPVHATRRSFISAARRTRSEDLLVLRRPPRKLTLVFQPPPYRMWDHEVDLRAREIESVLGQKPQYTGGRLTAQLDPYQVDSAQRLAFTHQILSVPTGPTWRTWQSVLENGDAMSARKDPKYLTHGIHAYKGKFYPQLAKSLLNLANVKHGDLVLDPFCGSGTVLLESQLNGVESVGCDLNPLAVLVSRAKTAVATESPVALDRTITRFQQLIETDHSHNDDLSRFAVELRGDIDNWFPTPVARRLAWVMGLIDRETNVAAKLVLQTLLSSIIREVSQQEPADLRIRRRKTPLKDAPVLDLLRRRLEVFRARLQDFGERSSAAPVGFPSSRVVEGDVSLPSTLTDLKGRVTCVVTSPPYATALPYIDTDRLSLLVVLGVPGPRRAALEHGLTGSREIRDRERRELESVIDSPGLRERLHSETAARIVRRVRSLNAGDDVGFRRRNMAALLFRYFSGMRQVFENVDTAMIPGGHLFFVIGDNRTVAGGQEVAIKSGRVLREIGEAVGWSLVDEIPISVTKEALLHSHNSITENSVLWFRAPAVKA